MRRPPTCGPLLAIPDSHHVVFCQGGASQQFSMVPMNSSEEPRATRPATWSPDHGARKRSRKRRGWDRLASCGRGNPTGSCGSPPTTNWTPSSIRSSGVRARHVERNDPRCRVPRRRRPSRRRSRSSPIRRRTSSRGRWTSRVTGSSTPAHRRTPGRPGSRSRSSATTCSPASPTGSRRCWTTARTCDHGSMYNTPPVFSIYVLMLVTRWLRDEVGGLEAQLERNREKATLLYDAIDESDGLLSGPRRPRVALPDERHLATSDRRAGASLHRRRPRRQVWWS